MKNAVEPKRFPALRARIGDWYYYVTTLPFRDVAERIQPATDLVASKAMSDWIQRSIIDSRASTIADYLIDRPQHFFPGIVVGVYLGEPTWYEISVEGNVALADPRVDAYAQYNLGLLELDGTEQLYAIDGQHRVAGIRAALKKLTDEEDIERHNQLANEDLSILFVSADIERDGQLERVRRLFTTLNKEAKKVSEPEIVALDEDDPAAILTRWIATRYDGLRSVTPTLNENEHSLIQFGRQHEIRASNRRSVTTIVTLYRTIKSIFQPELRAIVRNSKGNRPDEEVLEKLYEKAVAIWDLMRQYDSALNDVLGSDPNEERAAKYRTTKGGHILFRPVGLQAFAGALGILRSRGVSNERAVKSLCQMPAEISQSPWVQVLWNPTLESMITANKPVAEALFLYMVGHSPRSTRYDLRKRYSELLGDPTGDALQDVQIYDLR